MSMPPTLAQPGVGYGYNQPCYGSAMPHQQTTVVVVGQPGAVGGMRYDLNGVREFTYDLCDCFSDCEVCMSLLETYSYFCTLYCIWSVFWFLLHNSIPNVKPKQNVFIIIQAATATFVVAAWRATVSTPCISTQKLQAKYFHLKISCSFLFVEKAWYK